MKQGLHIIIGGSGSGKTSLLYDRLLADAQMHPSQQFFLIVPEQYSLQAQQDIVTRSTTHGSLNIDIVSFNRLGYRVFEELGTDLKTVLEDHGKSMLLRKVLGDVQKQLLIYKNVKDKPGFIDQVKSLISEFYQYEIQEEDVLSMLQNVEEDSLLHYKLSDILVIYQAFMKALGDQYQVSEQLLDVLCQVADESTLLNNACFYLDGYTGFTPNQYLLLKTLMSLASDFYITITMDEKAFRKTDKTSDLFSMSRKTYDTIVQLYGESENTSSEIDIITLFDNKNHRFTDCPALHALEQNLYRPWFTPFRQDTDQVVIWEAKSTRTEVHAVAQQIISMVKAKELRFHDVGVVCANYEEYEDMCDLIFSQYHIPHFMDQTQKVMNHPFIEALRAALNIVLGGSQGYTYDSMMRYINTGCAGISKREIEILDNYLIATNTVGKKVWETGFVRSPRKYWIQGKTEKEKAEAIERKKKYLQRMNEIRKKVMEFLQPLQNAMMKKCTVRDKAIAIYEYLTAMRFETRLQYRADMYKEEQNFVKAAMYEKVYPQIIALLEKLVDILGDEKGIANTELEAILDAGLAEMSMGTIPPTMDQVVVGDIRRTRLHDVKVLFVLGVNDSNIPAKVTSPNLLSDQDRKVLKTVSVELAPDVSESMLEEQFYIYRLLTKPSERLILGYARKNEEGIALRPSDLIGKVKQILPNVKCLQKNEEVYLESEETLYPYFVSHLKEYFRTSGAVEHKHETEVLFSLCQTERKYADVLTKVMQGMTYTNREDTLSKECVNQLFGTELSLSVTRLEQYAQCAFAHFLKYGLRVQEREEYAFQSTDFGSAMHEVLELFCREVKRKGLKYSELGQEQIGNITQSVLEQTFDDMGLGEDDRSERERFIQSTIIRMAQRNITMVCSQLAKGKFNPTDFEISFGKEAAINGMEYTFDDKQKMTLKGIIDRLDTYEDDDKMYLKVVDYKTGSLSLDLTKVYYGLQIQLLTYLLTVQKYYSQLTTKTVVPAAALYYHIKDPIIDNAKSLYGVDDEEVMKSIWGTVSETLKKEFVMEGIIDRSEEVLQCLETHEGGGYTYKTLPLRTTKTGDLHSNCINKCQTSDQIKDLLDYTENCLQQLGRNMFEGNVDVLPYAYKKESSCTFCPYDSICHFNAKNGDSVRNLENKEITDFNGGGDHE